jgi:hypothetical protein
VVSKFIAPLALVELLELLGSLKAACPVAALRSITVDAPIAKELERTVKPVAGKIFCEEELETIKLKLLAKLPLEVVTQVGHPTVPELLIVPPLSGEEKVIPVTVP